MKTVIVIQARMGSTRLPGKVLRPINKTPLLEHLLRRMEAVQGNPMLYVATSDRPENVPLIEFLRKRGIAVFAGDEENVLSRFLAIARETGCETLVRVTGDNPLTDPGMLELLVKSHAETGADYSFMTGLPVGVSAEAVRADKLLELAEKALESDDREHVTLYFKKHPECYKLNFVPAPEAYRHPELSMTVDTPADFEKMTRIFEKYGDSVTLQQAIGEMLP